MTEVSLPMVNHHQRQEAGSESQQQHSMMRTEVVPAANGGEQLPEGAASISASGTLFMQPAGGGGRLPPAPPPLTAQSGATIVQETLEEDQTIVIDLTEERCNLMRTAAPSSKSAATVTQWSGGGGFHRGRPPPTVPRQFATSADAHDGIMMVPTSAADRFTSSASSSLDVQLGQESGSHFLISRMLNGRAEAVNDDEEEDDEVQGGRTEILQITARVGSDHIGEFSRVPPLHPSSAAGTMFPPLNQSSADDSEDDDDDRNLSTSIPTERYVEKQPISEEEGWPPSLASPVKGPPPPAIDRRSHSLRRGDGGTPFNLFGSTSQSLSEVTPLPPTRYSAISSSMHRLRSSDGYRSLDRRMMTRRTDTAFAEGKSASIRARKSRSNDFLDRMDASVSSSVPGTTTTEVGAVSSRGRSRSRRKMPARMNKIEKGLYLGNMEAATDVILLESRGITHIVTLDTVPLPRKIASFLPRVSQLHLQVTDLPDEDLLSHVLGAVEFIRAGIEGGGNVLVHCFRGKSRSAAVVLAFLMQKYR